MYDVVEATRGWSKRRSIVGYYYIGDDSYARDRLTIPNVNPDIDDDRLLMSVAKQIFDLQQESIADYYEESHEEIIFCTQEDIDERDKEEDEDFD